jgi:hypothetical protein
VLVQVASFQGSPLELSYWVAHNLPLQPGTRLLLLGAPSPAARLRLLLGVLQRLDQLCCSSCGTLLAITADVLAMTSEGIGGTFVNSAGWAHTGCMAAGIWQQLAYGMAVMSLRAQLAARPRQQAEDDGLADAAAPATAEDVVYMDYSLTSQSSKHQEHTLMTPPPPSGSIDLMLATPRGCCIYVAAADRACHDVQ